MRIVVDTFNKAKKHHIMIKLTSVSPFITHLQLIVDEIILVFSWCFLAFFDVGTTVFKNNCQCFVAYHFEGL